MINCSMFLSTSKACAGSFLYFGQSVFKYVMRAFYIYS